MWVLGERFGVQFAHDFVEHGQDEGVSKRFRNAHRFDVPNCQRVPEQSGFKVGFTHQSFIDFYIVNFIISS